MTGRMLVALETVMRQERPPIVLVYGDTNSTLAGALAAAKLHIPVAHVEAGLRSLNMRMPEEINRVLTDRLSSLLFTPTSSAMQNLAKEGIDGAHVLQVGDVMYDVALHHGDRAMRREMPRFAATLQAGGYLLATIHRQENTDDPQRLAGIVAALQDMANNPLPVVWPVHPRTRAALHRAQQLDSLMQTVRVLDSVGYLDMLWLERNAAVIVTDSGGVQKEAFFHRVPCVTVRDETEWTELVTSGWNRLADARSPTSIQSAVDAALGNPGQDITPYGDGKAAERIASALARGELLIAS